jgi:uncharacterized protein (DUF2267 family)
MSQTGLAAFDTTVHVTNGWLKEVMEEMGWDDRHKAYHALREVLHALRDRLPISAVAALGAQLPLLVRGIYYDGWHPADKPVKYHRDQFLAHLAEALRDHCPTDARVIARTVFQVLARHVSAGEIESIRQCLPEDLRTLWAF